MMSWFIGLYQNLFSKRPRLKAHFADGLYAGYVRVSKKKPSAFHHTKNRSVRLRDVVGQYSGPDIVIDFGPDDELIGIEIVE